MPEAHIPVQDRHPDHVGFAGLGVLIFVLFIWFHQRPNSYLALWQLQSNPGHQIPK